MDPVTGLVLTTALCMGLSMFCSLFEAALYSVPMNTVRSMAEAGDRRWRRMLELKEDPGRPIAGILISNTIANTAGASMAGAFAQQVFNNVGVSIFSACLVLGILYFSEIIPKTIGVAFHRQLAPYIAWPIKLLVFVWFPVIKLTEVVTQAIQARAGDEAEISEWELATLMRKGVQEGTFRAQEARIVESVLRLDTLRVRDIMTPRTVMVTAPGSLSIAEAAQQKELWRHGRVPITGDDPDQVIGQVLRRDVLLNSDDAGRTLHDIASELLFAPELMRVDQLLDKLMSEKRHLAMVVDEYGQIEGLVTLEDVLEALIGREIVDELDPGEDLREKAEKLAEARREQLGVTDYEPADAAESDETR